jgi:hypothetical protein
VERDSLGELATIDLGGAAPNVVAATGLNLVSVSVHPTSGRIYVIEVTGPGGATNLYEVIPGDWNLSPATVVADVTPGSTNDTFWDSDFDDSTGQLYLNAYAGGGGDAVSAQTAADTAATQAITAANLATSSANFAVDATLNFPLFQFLIDGINTAQSGLDAATVTRSVARLTSDAGEFSGASAPTEADAAQVAASAAFAAANIASQAGYAAIDAVINAYYVGFYPTYFGITPSPSAAASANAAALVAIDLAAAAAANAAQAADDARIAANTAAVAAAAGEAWVRRIVDVTDASTVLAENVPTVTSIALATPPPPDAVLWSGDYAYSSAQPNGVQLIADQETLASAEVGTVVSGVGDVNGDGFEDFIITGQDATVQTEEGDLTNAGRAFLVYGSPEEGFPTLLASFTNTDVDFGERFIDGSNGLIINGSSIDEHLGVSATGLGDMDGDGLAEFALGFRGTDDEGGVYLNNGSSAFPGAFSTSDIGSESLGAAIQGARIYSDDENDRAGAVVAGAGDFNSDGFADMLIGAPDAGAGASVGPGAAYIIFGSSSSIPGGVLALQALSAPQGIRILGEVTDDQFGGSVSGAGDVNGDGVDDIVIGAAGAETDMGRVYVIFGHPDYAKSNAPSPLDLDRLSSGDMIEFATQENPVAGELANLVNPQSGTGYLPGFMITGDQASSLFGSSVAGVGDVDGDGIDDFAIGAPDFDGSAEPEPHWGRAYLAFGNEAYDPSMLVADIGSTTRGVVMSGVDNGDSAAATVAGAGDVNGDGFMDVLISAEGASPGGFSGEAYILLGREGLPSALSLRDLAGNSEVAPSGMYAYNTVTGTNMNFAKSVSAAGDFNNDGISDYLAGYEDGAFVLYGDTEQISAMYINRMATGTDPLSLVEGGGGVDLGLDVFKGVGLTGDRRMSKPASGVEIEFKGGGTGLDFAGPSTQRVTVHRESAPDLDVGDGTLFDDERWEPSGVYWRIETDRENFSRSEITLHYRPEDVEGFDLQRMAVFYAKSNASLTDQTVWSWLPFVPHPDRNAFTVTREHNEEGAQVEFNGYYALVEADLLSFLGDVIPAVGVTNENASKPDWQPQDRAFWHADDKKLYAVCEGELTITWKDLAGNPVSEVKAVNLWPADDSPVYQEFVAGSPAVSLSDSEGPYNFQSALLTCADDNVTISLTGNEVQAQFDSVTPPTARALVMLSTSQEASVGRGELFFQFIRVIHPELAGRMVPSTAGQDWDIGKIISHTTDSLHRAHHDDRAGGPFVYVQNAPYAPASDRYAGFYERATRTGSIVPVNVGTLDIVYYEKGGRLIEANTGNPARHPETRELLELFDWPYLPARYTLDWPDDADTIVIARQDGSGSLGVDVYGSELDVYFENTAGNPGYNPNEEHALIAAGPSTDAVFALRDDLNAYESASEPYVLLTYKDPNELGADGFGRAKMRVFKVEATQGTYTFSPWSGVPKLSNPYMGDVGAFILPPYPLSTFQYSERNTSENIPVPGDTTGRVFEDRTDRHWAMSDGTINMGFYYPVQEDFYMPSAYLTKLEFHARQDQVARLTQSGSVVSVVGPPLLLPGEAADFGVGGRHIPLLDGGPAAPSSASPMNVVYEVDWPTDVPVMKIGEILLEAKFGLPQINGQCSVDLIYQQSIENGGGPSAILIEPTMTRSVALPLDELGNPDLDPDIATAFAGTQTIFTDLPPALQYRVTYDPLRGLLNLSGIIVDPGLGFDYVLLNVINEDDYLALLALSGDTSWTETVDALYALAQEPIVIAADDAVLDPVDQPRVAPELADTFALTTGNAQGVGYVTLAMQNADTCSPLPVSIEVIKVESDLEQGSIAVINPACVFEEKLTLRHTSDFGGHPEDFVFEWLTQPDTDGTRPASPDLDPQSWLPVPINGATDRNELIIEGPGLLTLTDNWFVVRYRHKTGAAPYFTSVSDWTRPQLQEGWIKRVVGEINPFTQRASGGGIAGAEDSFLAFQSADSPNNIVSMISQAGPRFTGSLPLNCDNIDDFGLIPIYQTVENRGMDLSINALSPVDNNGVNTALLLVASRLADLYALLGNEAFADAVDPTIAFGTEDGLYGSEATSIHPFMNQTESLLAEELSLLRGRDETYGPGTRLDPLYNRLIWNFTRDITGGEVAYALNYNIMEDPELGNGEINEADAKRMYPQGHGDAWGHYLMAIKSYYKLLAHPFYTWVTRSEAVLVSGEPVTVDYIDETRFAKIAASKAEVGAQTVDLTYRSQYVEDPQGQWKGYKDDDTERAWGLSEWASRAGQGAYFDWVVGNAILPAEDPDPTHTGIVKIDRTTVHELRTVAAAYDRIQTQADSADLGLNPLGLGNNVVPFDIDPTLIDDGVTHFEQIYSRAQTAMQNAEEVFNHANNSTQLLRRQADSRDDFVKAVVETEFDLKSRLIEIFGYPYDDDIGPGGTYATGYDGPDIYHYMYSDDVGLFRDDELRNIYFNPERTSGSADFQGNIAAIADGVIAGAQPEIGIGEGRFIFEVDVVNYLGVNRSYGHPAIPAVETDLGDVLNIFSSSDDGYSAYDPFGGLGQASSSVLPTQSIKVKYHMSTLAGRFGIRKPPTWTGERRAPGELQLAQSELRQALARLMTSIDDYGGFVGDVQGQVALVEAQYGVSAHEIFLLDRRLAKKKTVQDVLAVTEASQLALRTTANIVEKVAEAGKESIPTVTGVIVGFSNGVIVDGLAPVRGGLSGAGAVAVEAIKILADVADLFKMRLQQNGDRADDQLNIDQTTLQGEFANLQALLDLESLLRSEIPFRIALHSQHDAVLQAAGSYLKVLAEGQRLMEERTRFRRQTAASIQTQRYNDMAFRIFRNEALQKYRAQYDLAARYVYMTAKAYDYETTMLSTDPQAGQRFLTDVVRARQLGTIIGGEPQTGVGLADSMATMARNFEVLSGQLGFNNPQKETNRFSLRGELFRTLPGDEGDVAWRTLLSQDYFTHGVGTAANLWDVPEFRRFCVPPAGFGLNEPGIVIPFTTTIEEGKNFFGRELGGLDNAYDSTQFATKIRSVGVWFSNYDFLNLSNTPRVYLVPAGVDTLRSPTGFTGATRDFNVLDQLLPVPFPIGSSELDDPAWIPSVESLAGHLTAIRRFGRLRAYHDSGQFDVSEVARDSRLVGRSVWNSKWMLIIPASTFSNDRQEGLSRFIEGNLSDGVRDGNGVSDIKLFFETYAYSRLKKDGGAVE